MSATVYPTRRSSVFVTGVERRLLGGILALSYGSAYVILLERGGRHALLDVLAFVCFAGIALTGGMNLIRGLAALRHRREVALILVTAACAGSWVYTSLADPSGFSGGQAAFYGLAAAAALASWIDAHRTGTALRWSLIGPIGLFALWSASQALESSLTYKYLALGISLACLASVVLLERQALRR